MRMQTTDDRRLLSAIQQSFPLAPRPYAQLSNDLGLSPDDVMKRIAALRHQGIIREISGIFDASALGYQQTLAAFAVPPEQLDAAGTIVAQHPGVSHCYGRQHHVNLWFTLAVSPQSILGLEKTVKLLAGTCNASQALTLPTLKRYKLQVQFDLLSEGFAPEETPALRITSPTSQAPQPVRSTPPPHLSEDQSHAIQALQVDLPVQEDPFSPLAEMAQTSVDGLLMHAHDFVRAGYLRRYAAVLHHRAAGAAANLLVAWDVPDQDADAAGRQAATVPAVSHCYLRPRAEGWPYNLYTMIHGHTKRDCLQSTQQVAAAAGLHSRAELWTIQEYKKQRMKLLSHAEREWEMA